MALIVAASSPWAFAGPVEWVGQGQTGEVAAPCDGSSNPTFLSNNRRLAVTTAGRILAIYDPHGSDSSSRGPLAR
jgi:hypothetical protein